MTETYAKFKVGKAYTEASSDITYCGVYGVNYVFGMVKTDEIETFEQPFYITVGDDGELTEVYKPMFQDEYYEESMFASYEDRFHYFEKRKLID